MNYIKRNDLSNSKIIDISELDDENSITSYELDNNEINNIPKITYLLIVTRLFILRMIK